MRCYGRLGLCADVEKHQVIGNIGVWRDPSGSVAAALCVGRLLSPLLLLAAAGAAAGCCLLLSAAAVGAGGAAAAACCCCCWLLLLLVLLGHALTPLLSAMGLSQSVALDSELNISFVWWGPRSVPRGRRTGAIC